MKRFPTYRERLKRALYSAPRITLHDADMIQAAELERQTLELERIRAKASAYIANNPAPRAVYLLG